jgi:heme/copper-type cytochrome/quinol oxidase subunit 2
MAMLNLKTILLQIDTPAQEAETSLLSTIIVVAILLLIFAAIIYRIYKRRKNCTTNACAGCPLADKCSSAQAKEEE